jgi:hypothetical protein
MIDYKTLFIKKANITHKDKYDYSLVDYKNSITKVEVICSEHGSFFVRPDAHVRKVGCPVCNGGIKYTKEIFIEKANIKHYGKYDYSFVEYINSSKKVEVICPEHGSFFISPSNHLLGQSCSICSGVKKKTLEQFIEISNIKHNNRYDYSESIYVNNRSKIKIICPVHGMFEQTAKDHMNGNGCKLCNLSKGELMVKNILDSYKIFYIREYKFESCKSLSGVKLPFDFYLPEYDICIEYDGRQHFEPVDIFGGIDSYERLVENDSIRNDWCKNNNKTLVTIYLFNLFNLKF